MLIPQEYREEEPEDQEGPEESPFLGKDREDEIRALLGKKLVVALRAMQPPLPVEASGADRGHRLDDVPTRSLGVDLRIHEYHEPHDLVVLQNEAKGDGQQSRAHGERRGPRDPEEIPFTE